ncbi:MAG: bifunctional helix-turn-helix domain-containing protein/methylated-DNA--[protein]-cysteine S-methyltransferase [Desulfuromonadales bacterium]
MSDSDYQRIALAIGYLEQHVLRQPSLEEVAGHVGLSPWHFQRLFKRWAGVSPKRYLQYLTLQHAKQWLQQSASVLDTALAVGLSGPGRLHDLFVTVDAVTPGEFKAAGKGLQVCYSFQPTPFGEALLAETSRGLCHLAFVDSGDHSAALEDLQQRWPRAILVEDTDTGRAAVRQIFAEPGPPAGTPIKLFLKGTNFQLKVWEALLKIPFGTVVSYGALAGALGQKHAQRAVGTAVGRNPVAGLIPCHRVLRASGALGGYRWGTARKKALLAWEACRLDNDRRAGD